MTDATLTPGSSPAPTREGDSGPDVVPSSHPKSAIRGRDVNVQMVGFCANPLWIAVLRNMSSRYARCMARSVSKNLEVPMRSLVRSNKRILDVVSTAAVTILLVACGGAKQAEARAPAPPPAEPLGRTNVQPLVPDTPTASNVIISEELLRACDIPDADAYFAFDSSRLTTFDHGLLDQLVTCFTRGPMAGRRLRLVGHADPRGAAEYNMTLGL